MISNLLPVPRHASAESPASHIRTLFIVVVSLPIELWIWSSRLVWSGVRHESWARGRRRDPKKKRRFLEQEDFWDFQLVICDW